jgi:hypothetical protein
LRIPHFLDNRLTFGGKIVKLKRRPSFTLRNTFWHSFLLETESPQGHGVAGRIIKIEKKMNVLIGTRTRGLPAFSIASQPVRWEMESKI